MHGNSMKTEKFTLSQKVKMASMGNLVFTVIAENPDGTYSVETQLDQQNVLSYGNISTEMLRNVTA